MVCIVVCIECVYCVCVYSGVYSGVCSGVCIVCVLVVCIVCVYRVCVLCVCIVVCVLCVCLFTSDIPCDLNIVCFVEALIGYHCSLT